MRTLATLIGQANIKGRTDMLQKHIATLALTFGLAFGASTVPTTADASQRLSMTEAKRICLKRAERYATDSVGPNGRYRSPYEVRAMYQRCIYRYTREHVRNVPPIGRR